MCVWDQQDWCCPCACCVGQPEMHGSSLRTAADACCLARLLLGPPGLWTRCLVALIWPTIQVPSLPADTISMLERALKDVHFSVDPKRPAKAQALEVGRVHLFAEKGGGVRVAISKRSRGLNGTCRWHMSPARRRFIGWPVSSAGPQFPQALPLLKSRFPIERARMRLKLLVPLGCKDELLELVRAQGGVLEEQDLIGGWRDRCSEFPGMGNLGVAGGDLKGGMPNADSTLSRAEEPS